MTDQGLRGRIAYISSAGEEVGRERFELLPCAGGRLLRALCEMDDVDLMREVSLRLDAEGRPRDAFCRVVRDGGQLGASLFLVGEGNLVCEGLIEGSGRISQILPLATPLIYLGLHPLVGDGLIATVAGHGAPGVFESVLAVTNSVSPNGDEGLSATPVTIEVAFVEAAMLTVEAGTFAARRLALRWKPDWPPAELWVRAEDGLFLQMRWPMVDTHYELVELGPVG
jgi:hypothetical protein